MRINEPVKLANLRMLRFFSKQLGPLRDDVVFLGGCTTALFITDNLSPDVRYTLDVDCIIDVISLNQYHQFERGLLAQGFKKSIQDDMVCRWHYEDVILDVIPTDEKILGFSNRWYKSAIQHSTQHTFSDDLYINVVTAPYFLATKLEAFKTRGNRDFLASHDFEDIISVIDGRKELVEEINVCDHSLKKYLSNSFHAIHNSRPFHDALPGHLTQYGNFANDRADIILTNVKMISNCIGA